MWKCLNTLRIKLKILCMALTPLLTYILFMSGYVCGKQTVIDDLCNKENYNFCQLVKKKLDSYKIKENFL